MVACIPRLQPVISACAEGEIKIDMKINPIAIKDLIVLEELFSTGLYALNQLSDILVT